MRTTAKMFKSSLVLGAAFLLAGTCNAKPKPKPSKPSTQKAAPAAQYQQTVIKIFSQLSEPNEALKHFILIDRSIWDFNADMERQASDLPYEDQERLAKQRKNVFTVADPGRKKWLASIAQARPLVQQLQTISPVPNSMRELDGIVTDFAATLNRALDAQKFYIYNQDLAAFEKAEETYTLASRKFDVLSEKLKTAQLTTQKPKKYIPG